MKSFTLKCIIFVAVMAALNTATLLSKTEAAGKVIYNAGLQLKDWEGKVIGCECPTVNGTCICKNIVLP